MPIPPPPPPFYSEVPVKVRMELWIFNRSAKLKLELPVYRQQKLQKKRKYATRVLEVELLRPLAFSTAGGMGEECARYHSRLAELLTIKKGETYNTTISWIRAKVSSALLRGEGGTSMPKRLEGQKKTGNKHSRDWPWNRKRTCRSFVICNCAY